MLRHRKLLKRFNVPGEARFLTFSCFHRLPLLSKDRTRTWLVEALTAARRKYGFQLWAWVIMPEHVHLLLLPNDGRVTSFLNGMKRTTASKAMEYLRVNAPDFLSRLAVASGEATSYRFWQHGGRFDVNVTEPDRIHQIIEYIHNNPVKRALVQRPEDWNWSSARAWLSGIDEPIAIDRTVPVCVENIARNYRRR